MANLGFVFEIFSHEVFEKKEVFFDKKKFEKRFIVVFVSSKKIKSDCIIGLHDFLHNEECEFVYLNSNLGFSSYLMFEGARYKYGKICVYDRRVVDFVDLTFWFDVRRYKEVRDILTINNLGGDLEKELSSRILRVLEYF